MLPTKALLLAALSATASATVSLIEVIHIVEALEVDGTSVHDILEGSSANNGSPHALFAKRATSEECSSSVEAFIAATPTGAPGISAYLESAVLTEGCTITAHSSMSTDIFEYISDVLSFVFEEVSVAESLSSKCPQQWPTANDDGFVYCYGGGTILFTSEPNATATSTVAVTDAFRDFTPPSPKEPGSVAPAIGVSLSGLAAAGLVAVMISL